MRRALFTRLQRHGRARAIRDQVGATGDVANAPAKVVRVPAHLVAVHLERQDVLALVQPPVPHAHARRDLRIVFHHRRRQRRGVDLALGQVHAADLAAVQVGDGAGVHIHDDVHQRVAVRVRAVEPGVVVGRDALRGRQEAGLGGQPVLRALHRVPAVGRSSAVGEEPPGGTIAFAP